MNIGNPPLISSGISCSKAATVKRSPPARVTAAATTACGAFDLTASMQSLPGCESGSDGQMAEKLSAVGLHSCNHELPFHQLGSKPNAAGSDGNADDRNF